MEQFLNNLKREAEANPTLTLGVIAGLLTAAGKFVDAAGRHKGSTAYAKDVERRLRAERRS
jgi:hypothetical protein